MKHFIPKDKLSKKARRALDLQKRQLWSRCPAARVMESRKTCKRHRKSHELQDDWRSWDFFSFKKEKVLIDDSSAK